MHGTHTDTSANQTKCLLALKMIKGIGNATALKLLQKFQSAGAVFQASYNELRQAGLRSVLITQIMDFDFCLVDEVLAWAKPASKNIISINSPHYPPLLSQINSPPIILFTIGNPEVLLTPQIAVVGTRNPTVQGLNSTSQFSKAIVEHGLSVTSGLAIGIDGEAHRAALEVQGYTIAVTGTGLNRVYPARHRELAHRIADKGVLVSEKFPNEPFDQGSFQQRNRIIAGLSLGTLVVEAAKKSGSLITANCAMEEGREVYAIPGSIHNPQVKGCHSLIKQGAKLVESIEDIIEDLPCVANGQVDKSNDLKVGRTPLNQQDTLFLQHIDFDITPVDLIVTRSQLTVEAVTNKLLLLELDGWVINSAGGYIRQY